MSLKIIYGRAGSGKSHFLLEDMKKSEDSIYIVPEQFSFSAEKKIIDAFKVGGLGNPQATSFKRLSGILFSIYGSPEFVSDNASGEMLVSYCANSLSEKKLRLFDGLVKKSELASTASLIITTFRRYKITPQMLRKAAEAEEGTLLSKKLYDSALIYESYLSMLDSAGITDLHDSLSKASEIVLSDRCTYFDSKTVYIDQFSDFDPSEYEFILAIMKKAKRVLVGLCFDDSPHFATVQRTYSRLIDFARKNSILIEPQTHIEGSMRDATPMIRHLEKTYFSEVTAPFSGTDDSIKIHCAANKTSEIHHVASEIFSLVRDKGYRYRDISVVARDIEEYKGIIDRIFPLYNIPLFMDRKTPLSGHCITVFITSVLDILISGFTYDNVFTFIKSPFSPFSKEQSDLLENYCLAAGIRPYSWKKPFVSSCGAYNPDSSVQKGYSKEQLDELNKNRETLVSLFYDLESTLKNGGLCRDICACLFEFFEKISLEESVQTHAQELENRKENLAALRTMQVYNMLVDIFDDMCSVLGDKKLTLREFRTTLVSGFAAVEIGTIPISSDCVTVGSIDRIKGHGAKAVLLVGVNNGKFPAAITDNGFFSDSDKLQLSMHNIELPPGVIQKGESENLLVYDALTCGTQKLFISYPVSDSEGATFLPSEITERIHALFPDILFTDNISGSLAEDVPITSKAAVFEELTVRLRDHLLGVRPLPSQLSAAAAFFKNDEIYSSLLNQAMEMTGYTNAPEKIRKELMDSVSGQNQKTSITRLEAYNSCPFSYFAKYLLQLEPREVFTVSYSDSGSFLHDFLDRFSEYISNCKDENGLSLSWNSIDIEFIKKNTPVVLNELFSSVSTKALEIPRIKALFDRLSRVAEQSAIAVYRHIKEGDFVPLGFEISFDENGAFKPKKITLADGKKITLRGRIDRADEFIVTMPDGTEGKFVRIVDYKSSSKSLVLSDVYHGVQLQLFVYLSAMCDENGYNPGGILYCNLSDSLVSVSPDAKPEEILEKRIKERRMTGIVASEHEMFTHMGGDRVLKSVKSISIKKLNAMFRHIEKTVKNTVENIAEGIFPIEKTEDACLFCDYSSLCRFDEAFSGCRNAEKEKLSDIEVLELIGGDNENEMD